MRRFSVVLIFMSLVMGVLVGCSGAGTTASSTTETSFDMEAAASLWPITPLPNAGVGSGSSDVASSDAASSDRVSSDTASSDQASSDTVSSDAVSSDIISSDAVSSNAASSGQASSGASSGSSGAASGGASGLTETNVAMHYISQKDMLAAIEAGDKSKLVVDLRKPEDAKAGYIQGAIFAPVNKAVDNNNYADAIANITGALYDATGNEVGEGKDLVLVCYAGKKYAQAATDILNALGADMDKVYTLEGGMTAWNEAKLPTVTK